MKKIISIFILCLILISLSGCANSYFKKTKTSENNEIYEKLKAKAEENNNVVKYRNDVIGFELMIPKNFYPDSYPYVPEDPVSDSFGYVVFGNNGVVGYNNSFQIDAYIPEDLNYDLDKIIKGFGKTSIDEKYIDTDTKITNDNFIFFVKNGYIFKLHGDESKTIENIKSFFNTLKFDKNINNSNIKIGETDLFTYQDPIDLSYERQEIFADVLKMGLFYYSKNVEGKLNNSNKIIGYKFYIKNKEEKNNFNVYALPRNIFKYKTKNDFMNDFSCKPKGLNDDSCTFFIHPENIQFTKDYILFPFVDRRDLNSLRQSYEEVIKNTLKIK